MHSHRDVLVCSLHQPPVPNGVNRRSPPYAGFLQSALWGNNLDLRSQPTGYAGAVPTYRFAIRHTGAWPCPGKGSPRAHAPSGKELLIDPELLQKIWTLRKPQHPIDEIAAMEFLLDKMKNTKSNDEFFSSMKR